MKNANRVISIIIILSISFSIYYVKQNFIDLKNEYKKDIKYEKSALRNLDTDSEQEEEASESLMQFCRNVDHNLDEYLHFIFIENTEFDDFINKDNAYYF